MIWVPVVLAVLVLVSVFHLRGPSLRAYDLPAGESFDTGHEPSEEHDAVVASLDVGIGPVRRAPRRQRLALMRQYMDSVSASQDFHAQFTPVDAGGVAAEWVLASESELLFDDARRYVNRAAAPGSPAELQSWAHVVHVWHMFYPQLIEARDAWLEIRKFITAAGDKA